jgi:uncharacterized protein
MPTDMAVIVTPVFAAILVPLVVVLTLRVVYLRRTHKIGIGSGENRQLAKAVRAHANAVETIPLALVVMLAAELAGGDQTVLLAAGSILVVGRVLHAFGLSAHAGYSFGRFFGMVMTLAAVLILAAAGVLAAL